MRCLAGPPMVMGLIVLSEVCVWGHPELSPPPDEYTFDLADKVVEVQLLENREYYDAGIATSKEKRWVAWLEFVPEHGDYLWFGERTDRGWNLKTRLTQSGRQLKNPTLTLDGSATLWLSYEAESEGQWDILVRQLKSAGEFSPVRRITSVSGQDIQHAVAPDPRHGIHVAWQQERDGQFDIASCHVTAESTSSPYVVSAGSRYGDWNPDIAVTVTGTKSIAWHAYDGKAHNVYARIEKDGQWSDVIPIAQSAAYEGQPSLAVDEGRTWILWEEGGRNWGKTFTSHDYPMTAARGALHRFRMLRLALLDEAGRIHTVEPQPPMPMFQQAISRANVPRGSELTGCYYERGRLLVDDQGRLWLVYRHFYAPKFLGARKYNEDNMGLMYAVFGRYLDGGAWSDLYVLDAKQGDGEQRLDLAPWKNGIALAGTIGRTHRRFEPIVQIRKGRDFTRYLPRGLVLAYLSADDARPDRAVTTRRTEPIKPNLAAAKQRPSPVMTVGGTEYKLVYGDLHRHTDLSHCYHMADGSLTDAYRYAMGPAGLDFLAITDHACDLNWGNANSQVWWRSCKEVSRHLLAPRFISFYSFEHSRNYGDMGLHETDHNVIALRPDVLRPEFIPYPELTKELGDDAFLIPHAPINSNTRHRFTIWDFHPPSHQRPLLEIFQGFRAYMFPQSEGEAQKGLDHGHRIGFIASSDHQSTAASYACVWTEERSREAIFRAMQARRTFAATAHIELAVRAGGYWMGEEFTVAEFPEVTIDAKGTAPVDRVEVILDGELVETLPQTEKTSINLTWSPRSTAAKSTTSAFHYLYFRLVQTDGNRAWSSPLFVHLGTKAARPPDVRQDP